MPFVPATRTALVEVRASQGLQEVENTLYFRYADPVDSTMLIELGERVLLWWQDDLAPIINSNVTLREIVVTDLTTATSPQITITPPGTNTGTNLAPPLTNSVTLTVSFRTANRGRSFRGRNYVVGLSSSDLEDSNNFKETTLTAVISSYLELFTVATDTTTTWVVVSRFSGVDSSGKPIPRATAVSTPVNAVVIVDPIADNQRRRLPKRGK